MNAFSQRIERECTGDVNVLWTRLFFGRKRPHLALLDSVVLFTNADIVELNREESGGDGDEEPV